MKQPAERLQDAEKQIAKLKADNEKLTTALKRMESVVRQVEARAKRAQESARSSAMDITALKRTLGKR